MDAAPKRSPTKELRRVVDEFNGIESLQSWEGVLKVFLPIWLTIAGVILLYIHVNDDVLFTRLLGMLGAYLSVSPTKEFTILTGLSFGLDPLTIVISIVFLDAVVSMFLIWNYAIIRYIPLLGKFLMTVERAGKRAVKRYPWISQLEMVGIAFLIMIPFQTLGGVVCSFIGKAIGMDSLRLWMALIIGTALSSTIIAFYSDLLLGFVPDSLEPILPAFSIILLIGFAVAIFVVGSRDGEDTHEAA